MTRARLVRICLAMLVPVLSLTLVTTTATAPAAAFSGDIGPVVLKQALRNAPKAATVVAAGACSTGVGCIVTGVISLGLLAYSTKDAWLPILRDFTGPRSGPGSGPTVQGCALAFTNATPNTSGTLVMTIGYPSTCTAGANSAGPQIGFSLSSIQCISRVSGTLYSVSRRVGEVFARAESAYRVMSGTATGQAGGAAGQVSLTLDVNDGSKIAQGGCTEAGDFPYSTVATPTSQRGTGPSILIRWPIPDDAWATKTDVTCMRANGTRFYLSDTDYQHPGRLAVPSCYDRDPTSIPTDVTATDPGGDLLLQTQFPDWTEEYPSCFTPAGMVCETTVWVDDKPCVTGQPGCEHWWRHRDPTSPWFDRTFCKFGPYVVPIRQCEPLKRSYRPDAPPEGDPIREAQPLPEPLPPASPELDPPPSPRPSPSPSIDPSPSPSPNPSSNPNPSSSPFPSSGPNPTPGSDPVPKPDPTTDPDSEGCLGKSWTWNPVSWVYAPVKCALIWAFVPSPGFMNGQVGALRSDFDASAPGQWIKLLGGLVPSAPSAGSCAGPSFSLPVVNPPIVIEPFNACGGMANFASFVKSFATVGLVLFGVLGCIRGLLSGLGLDFKVGSGGDSA